jgi:hypothetical protein
MNTLEAVVGAPLLCDRKSRNTIRLKLATRDAMVSFPSLSCYY